MPDHPGRCWQSYGCTPVVPWSFPDHPGRLPGLCRDVSETVALTVTPFIAINIMIYFLQNGRLMVLIEYVVEYLNVSAYDIF
jgi:hypothetical protein